MAVIMIARDGGLLNGAVHSLDLAICPWMLDLGFSVFDAALAAGVAKYMLARDVVLFAVGELDTIVCENGMNGVRNSFHEI